METFDNKFDWKYLLDGPLQKWCCVLGKSKMVATLGPNGKMKN